MNAITPFASAHAPFELSPDMVTAIVRRMLRAAVDRWALVRIAAHSIPAEVDLDNECAVALALLTARFSAREIMDFMTDAVDLARTQRGDGRAKR